MIFCVVLDKFQASFVDFFLVKAVLLQLLLYFRVITPLTAAYQSTCKKNTLQDGKHRSIFSPKQVLTQCHEVGKYK